MVFMINSAQLKRPYHLAKGILANLLYGFPSRSLNVIAVTGTDGKTTTSTLIYHILKTAGKKVALISTVAAYIGDEEIDTGFHVTSPEEFALQKLLRRIADEGFEYVVLEATSHGIYQHRLFGITPTVSVLTNITHEHLDYHKTYENYLVVKTSLLARSKMAVINAEDVSYGKVRSLLSVSQTVVVPYTRGIFPKKLEETVKKRFPEAYNRMNAAAAYVAACELSVKEGIIAKAVSSFPQIPGRMENIPNSRGITVVVDFAHTPNALKEALTALKRAKKPTQKLIAVFGAAGLRDSSKRSEMGEVSARLADEVVLTAEDPRTEDVNVIIRQIKEGIGGNYGHVHEIADRKKAIEFALKTLAKHGDIVGVFGKGHEKSINLDGKRELPWSDQETVKQVLS